MKPPAFPYMASLAEIAEPLVDLILELRPNRLVDPMCGSAAVPYALAKEGIPVCLAELNAYAAYNAYAIFVERDVPVVPRAIRARPSELRFTSADFGYWSKSYRLTIDALLEADLNDPTIRAAIGRALVSATFRGQEWCDIRADGVNVSTADGFHAALDIASALKTIKRKNVALTGDHTVHHMDWKRHLDLFVEKGDVVLLDPPWPWPGELTTNPFAFYDGINTVLTGKECKVNFDPDVGMYAALIAVCCGKGATVIAFKQSHTTPPPTEMHYVYGQPSLTLPIRGRGKVSGAFVDAREEIWICQP